MFEAINVYHVAFECAHLDIKPENFVYDSETDTIRLIDFSGGYTQSFCSLNSSWTRLNNDIESLAYCILYMNYGNRMWFKGGLASYVRRYKKHFAGMSLGVESGVKYYCQQLLHIANKPDQYDYLQVLDILKRI